MNESTSDAELDEFMRNEAEEEKQRKRRRGHTKASNDANDTRLFMQLSWSEQRKAGTTAPVLRQVEGDSINQRIRVYRKSILFHINGKLIKTPSVQHVISSVVSEERS